MSARQNVDADRAKFNVDFSFHGFMLCSRLFTPYENTYTHTYTYINDIFALTRHIAYRGKIIKR